MYLTPGMIHDLKSVSDLSTRKGWEYAGKLDITRKKGKLVYRGITYATSKQRGCVHHELVRKMWDGPVTYHTHPGIGGNHATLPSDEDFGWCSNDRVSIICDQLGYYVIRVQTDQKLNDVMRGVRRDPFLRERQINRGGFEYFATTLPEWKNFIDHELSPLLLSLHGVDLSYHGYDELHTTVIA